MSLKENFLNIQGRIDLAKSRINTSKNVELIAATKTRNFDVIRESYACGITSIGENRIQEAELKFGSFIEMPKLNRRFIGHLQSNKIKKCLTMFDTIDSIHSLKLAKKINNQLKTTNNKISTLLEINISGDISKHGFRPDNIEEILETVEIEALSVCGLMTLGPTSREESKTRKAFAGLRKLKEKINKELGVEKLIELSMGMSGDFELGIEEGSTMVRVGTALFGNRDN